MSWLKATLIIIALAGVVVLVGFSFSVRLAEVPTFEPVSPSRLTLDQLSYEQKIGQRFILGFQGTSVTLQLKAKIKNLHPGGVLLLKRNIENEEQLKKLTENLQQVALNDTGLPLLIAVDQEGKPLCRIDWLECKALSEIKSRDQAFRIGARRGRELKQLGVNLNLAPVVEQSEKGDFIYPRTFQSKRAGELARSFVEGHQRAGVFTVLKHFPGYTGIKFDPERLKLPRLKEMPQTSQFETALEANPAMVMVANVIYEDINGKLPFSLTSEGIEFTREKLKPGLVISDDLASPVLKEKYGLEQVIDKADRAGIDVLLVAGFEEIKDTERAIDYLKRQDLDSQQLNKSLLKIIKLKQELNYEEDF